GGPRKDIGTNLPPESRDRRPLAGMKTIELGHAKTRRLCDLAQRDAGIALLGDQAEEGLERLVRCLAHPASSFERRDAAASALSNTGWMPSAAISTFRASAVVPPGLVTLMRNCCAASLDCLSSSPLPATVARASCMAISGDKPSLAPAAAIASTSRNT